MKKIKLTRGLVTLIDNEDFKKLSEFKWFAYPHGKTFYAMRKIIVNGKSHKVRMHREIIPVESGQEIDHKDRNGLNNQKSNLRVCTRAENIRNRGIQRNNKSGFIGVFWRKDSKKWRAYIRFNKKLIHLGSFKNKKEAVKVRSKALKKYHKNFAYA